MRVTLDPKLHHAAATLAEIGGKYQPLDARRGSGRLEQGARRGDRLPFELAPADRTHASRAPDQHRDARLARRRASDGREHDARDRRLAHEHAEQFRRPLVERAQPAHRDSPTLSAADVRAASMARSTDSGVAGAASFGMQPGGPH